MSSLSLMVPGEWNRAPGTGCHCPRLPACASSSSSRLCADPGRDTFHENRAFPWVLAHACPGPQLCPPVSKTASSLAQGRACGLGGGKAWLSPSADANSPCALARHWTSLFPHPHSGGQHRKAQGPVQLFPVVTLVEGWDWGGVGA